MANLQHRLQGKHILDHRGIRIVLWLAMGMLALSVVRSGVTVWLLEQKREEIALALAHAGARVGEREQDLQTLETPQGVEKALRSAFNIKKPEEHTIIILDPTPTVSQDKGVRAWWGSLKQWFIHTP